MSANYEEPGYAAVDIAEDLLCANNDKARSLFEAGDIYGSVGKRRPFAGPGEYAERLRAVIGNSEADYLRALEWDQQREFPDRYIRKRRRLLRTAVSSPDERLIGVRQFCDAYAAVAFANSKGAILNTLVTLSWSRLGYEADKEASSTFQSEVIKHMREWHSHKADPLGRPFAWMYAHERSAAVGLHTHLLVFIPYEWRTEFRVWFRRRVAQFSRVRQMPREALDIADARADRPLWHQWRQFGYLMKSIDPQASLPVYPGSTLTVPLTDLIPWPQEGPGEVRCKVRVGCAQVIGASARAKEDWRSLLDIGITDVRLLYGDFDYKGWQLAQKEEWERMQPPGFARDRDGLYFDAAFERLMADDDFQRRFDDWLQMAKRRDEWHGRSVTPLAVLPTGMNIFPR
jgi:hypothetical protein